MTGDTGRALAARIWRIRAAALLMLGLAFGCVTHETGRFARRRANEKQAAWKQARTVLPASGCSICGRLAQFDISRLRKEAGRVVGRVHLGFRCSEHRDAESIAVESGACTARMLRGLALLIAALSLGFSAGPLIRGEAHPLWPRELLRPGRLASLMLAATIWFGVSGYVLWVGFNEAYLTLPLWMGVGGILCLWLHELLVGGAYLRCTTCAFEGNLRDVRHFAGTCPGCGSDRFRVQELLAADRKIGRTTYRFRMMVGLTLAQLEELERDGRIWKEPRGTWRPLPELTT